MGSPAEAAYRRLHKRLTQLKDVRERPEKPGAPLARWSVKPTLWLQGKRFVFFYKDEDRRFCANVRVPQGLADGVPEARPTPDGDLEAPFLLARKGDVRRLEEVALHVYEGMTGRRVT